MADFLDKNGIKNIYLTRQGGREWVIGDKAIDQDPQLREQGQLTLLQDGYYAFDDPTAARLGIAIPSYIAAPPTSNHSSAVARGWMSSPSDWGDAVEFTIMFNATVAIPNENVFNMMGPTGQHPANVVDCSGSSYGLGIHFYTNPPLVHFFKEQYHNEVVYTTDREIPQFNFELNGHGDIGSKYIIFLKYGPDRNLVKLEHWMNGNGDKVTWVKVNETTDSGGWGTLDQTCGGTGDQILNYRNGIMRIWFNWTQTDFKFKYLSVREVTINPNEVPSQPPVVVPPPQVGIFRRVYSIIYDMGVYVGMGCSADLPEPPVEGEETHEIYSVPQNATDLTPLDNETHRQAIYVNDPACVLIGEKPTEVTWRLRKEGSPSADEPITSHIRRGTDDAIVETFDYTGGELTADTLSPTTFNQYTFRNINANYALQDGDAITVEWTDGTTSDYVEVAENVNDPFDGANTCKRKFDNGGPPPTSWGSPQEARDLAAIVRAKGAA